MAIGVYSASILFHICMASQILIECFWCSILIVSPSSEGLIFVSL